MNLELLQIETGMTFGQECYLDPSRAREFLTKVNEMFPNFFTRNDGFRNLPEQFVLANPNSARQCIVRPNSFNYSARHSIVSPISMEPPIFLNEVEKIFDCFKNLFALKDVRRIGKIYDWRFPINFEKDLLSNILKIDELAEVNNLQLLFREEGKNINIHFQYADKGFIEFAGRRTELEPGVIIRCDINNIEMRSPLNIAETLREIFEFADRYVQIDLINFLNKYFGDIS